MAALKILYYNFKSVVKKLVPAFLWDILYTTRINTKHKLIDLRQQYRNFKQKYHLYRIPPAKDAYESWIEVNQVNPDYLEDLTQKINRFEYQPLISILVPVYNTPGPFLIAAIESVLKQSYSKWELCIADDCSTDPSVKQILSKYSESDARIKVLYRTQNGNISEATNSAASIATGDYLLFLDHDDELTINCLAEVALCICSDRTVDFIYSDDDKMDMKGKRFDPQFKPDWSPELLLSYMYLGHVCVVRKVLFDQVGGIRVGYEGSQDYDFALRVTELCKNIVHISKVLYHWRAIPGSTAVSGSEKPKSIDAGMRALKDAFDRRNYVGDITQQDWARRAHLGLFNHTFPNNGPSVTIIIPTKNQYELLKKCIDSVITQTTYKNYSILVIDNESDDPKTLEYLDSGKFNVIKIKNDSSGFNYALIHNKAVETVQTELILFLNNDVEIITKDWLSQMVGYAQMEGVGAVGAKLLYDDHTIQHAGVVLGLHEGLCGHAFKLLHESSGGYLSYTHVPRNYSAVTAACMLTSTADFRSIGGFDAINFGVAYNDVDYCMRLLAKNKRCVYSPLSVLYHYEGRSRGFMDNPKETFNYKQKYGGVKDAYYNSNLSLDNEQFQIEVRVNNIYKRSPIKMLVCTHVLDYTGSPLHQFEIIKRLVETGSIEPIVYSYSDGPLRKQYEDLNITVLTGVLPLHDDTYDFLKEKIIREIMLQNNIEMVYANTLETFFMVDCAHGANIPSVWNVHESELWKTYFSNKMSAKMSKVALNCFQYPYKVVFVSRHTSELYKDLNSNNNFSVIHNGLSRERMGLNALSKEQARNELDIQENEMMILLLGTVCERKGQLDIIKAIEKLTPDQFQNIRIFIVGDRASAYSTKLKNAIVQLPQSKSKAISVINETNMVELYYKAADLFVLTSRVESFPRVILEAMAYNLPIISTPVYGVKEQVKEGVNGLFYNPGDVNRLAENILELKNNTKKRIRFATNSTYVLGSLTDFDQMVDYYKSIFEEASSLRPEPVISAAIVR